MKGTKEYRFKNNPKEKEFHDKFIELFNDNHGFGRKSLSAIVNGWANDRQNEPVEYLSEKEETICLHLIQWLGSSVGQAFLRSCGFAEVKDEDDLRF